MQIIKNNIIYFFIITLFLSFLYSCEQVQRRNSDSRKIVFTLQDYCIETYSNIHFDSVKKNYQSFILLDAKRRINPEIHIGKNPYLYKYNWSDYTLNYHLLNNDFQEKNKKYYTLENENNLNNIIEITSNKGVIYCQKKSFKFINKDSVFIDIPFKGSFDMDKCSAYSLKYLVDSFQIEVYFQVANDTVGIDLAKHILKEIADNLKVEKCKKE